MNKRGKGARTAYNLIRLYINTTLFWNIPRDERTTTSLYLTSSHRAKRKPTYTPGVLSLVGRDYMDNWGLHLPILFAHAFLLRPRPSSSSVSLTTSDPRGECRLALVPFDSLQVEWLIRPSSRSDRGGTVVVRKLKVGCLRAKTIVPSLTVIERSILPRLTVINGHSR